MNGRGSQNESTKTETTGTETTESGPKTTKPDSEPTESSDSTGGSQSDQQIQRSEIDSPTEAKQYVSQQVQEKYSWAERGEHFKIWLKGDKYVAEFTDAGKTKAKKTAVVNKIQSKYSGLEKGEDFHVQTTENGAKAEFTEQGRRNLLRQKYDSGSKEVVDIEKVTEGGYKVTVNPTGDSGHLAAPGETQVEAVPFNENAKAYFEASQQYADVQQDLAEDLQNAKRMQAGQEARETRERRNEAMEIQLGKAGVDIGKAEAETGRDIDSDGSVTTAKSYLAKEVEQQSRFDLQAGQDFEVVREDSRSEPMTLKKATYGRPEPTSGGGQQESAQFEVRLTEEGMSSVEKQIETENPSVAVNVTRSKDGSSIQIEQVEQFGDTDWTPFVKGDPIEAGVDSATSAVQSEIDSYLKNWKQSGGPQAFLYATNPGAMAYDTTKGTDVYGDGARVAASQFAETSANMLNLPGYVSGGLEAAETVQYAAGGIENAEAIGEAAYSVGSNAVDWAVDNPRAAVGGGLATAGAIVVGSATETAAYSRLTSLSGRSIPSLRGAASVTFKQFKRGGGGLWSAGRRVRSGIDTAQSRTPSVRLEKDADSGLVNVDSSARRQVQDELRVTGRQIRDTRDSAATRLSSAQFGFGDVASGFQTATSRARKRLPERSDVPSRQEVVSGVRSRANSAVNRPVGRANDLARRIRREAVSARFKIAEKVRRDREVARRERAKQLARREIVNARFALAETVDGIERPSVRDLAPSREDALAMTTQKLEDIKRRGRIEAKNLEFRAAGAFRGTASTFDASRRRVTQFGGSLANAGKRLVSEMQDIDQYGVRVTASDDWKAARETYANPDFSGETLLKNVDDRNSDIDAGGQLGDLKAEAASAGTESRDDARATSTGQTETEFRSTSSGRGNSQSVRSQAGGSDARLVDRARVEQERGPLSRETHDEARTFGEVGGAMAGLATLEEAQTSRVGVIDGNQVGAVADANSASAGARDRLKTAEAMAAAGATGNLEKFEKGERIRVTPGARLDFGADIGARIDTDLRLDLGTRLDQRQRLDSRTDVPKSPPPDRPPRTPGLPDFRGDPQDEERVLGAGFGTIQYTNPVATASGAFFGGFSVDQSKIADSMSADVDMTKSKSKNMDLDVTGGEL